MESKKDTIKEFTDNQLDLIYHIRKCIKLYNTIYPENKNAVSTLKIYYHSLFGFIEKLIIESVIISICKLIHKPNNLNKQKSNSHYYSLFNLRKDNDTHSISIIDNFYSQIENTQNNFDYNQEGIKFEKNLYNRLFDYRDKFLAHLDSNKMDDKHEAQVFIVSELFPLVDIINEAIIEIRKKYKIVTIESNFNSDDFDLFFNDIISNRIDKIINR